MKSTASLSPNRTLLCAFLLLFLTFGAACAEAVPSPPEGHVLLDSLWLDAEQAEALLLLGSKTENTVRLGIAQRTDAGAYTLTALTQPILPYDKYVSALSYLYIPWQTEQPTFWWGFRTDVVSDEICLALRRDAEFGWLVAYGYVARTGTPSRYTFMQEAPGMIAISGDMPYPQIGWQTNFPMALDGFNLPALEGVCREALTYLHAFEQAQGIGAQDGVNLIDW